MGYRIQSAFTISPNDLHNYFIYYISGNSMECHWIDEWFNDTFSDIANMIGSENGVLVRVQPTLRANLKQLLVVEIHHR